VLALVCKKQSYKQIAQNLTITESAVKGHMNAVYRKLGLEDMDRDERIIAIHTQYCPLLSEDRGAQVREVEPEPEPELEPVTPAQEKVLDDDEKALVVYQPPAKKFAAKPNRIALGWLKPLSVILLLALLAWGAWQGWRLIQGIPVGVSGQVYEVGEWHKEGDLWLRLNDYSIEADAVYFRLEAWNHSSQDILFHWGPLANISLRDNIGFRYQVDSSYDLYEFDERVPAGTRMFIYAQPLPWTTGFDPEPLYRQNVTELFLTVEYFLRIEQATWRVQLGN